jgi:hypothetical protein
MKTIGKREGFIKALTLIVVGGCFVLILFAVLAQYVGPQLKNISNPEGASSGSTGSDYFNAPNPLLPSVETPIYGSSGNNYYTDGGTNSAAPVKGHSPYAGKVTLNSGNASYSAQPFEEYVSIQNNGGPVNITGWTLTNGKGTRPIQNTQNNYFYPTADSATIGQGTEFLDPSGRFQLSPIILAAGDTVIVTTGGPFASYPFSITTSFRENICLGYLENYPFTPSVNQYCPYPAQDPDIRSVTDECYDYLQSINRCTNPEKQDKKRFDNLTTQCRNFITARFNYPSCVARNQGNPGFSSNQYRVFLGKKAELWASRRETITLYDTNNLIVDQISY